MASVEAAASVRPRRACISPRRSVSHVVRSTSGGWPPRVKEAQPGPYPSGAAALRYSGQSPSVQFLRADEYAGTIAPYSQCGAENSATNVPALDVDASASATFSDLDAKADGPLVGRRVHERKADSALPVGGCTGERIGIQYARSGDCPGVDDSPAVRLICRLDLGGGCRRGLRSAFHPG